MPKVIPSLRESLIDAARKRLLYSDSHDITMRQIAADCNAAAGTAYNYFRSKEHLMATVMMRDWRETCRSLTEAAAQSEDLVCELRAIEGQLRDYVNRYRPAWNNYAGHEAVAARLERHRGNLINPVADAIAVLLEKHGRPAFDGEAAGLAEILLVTAQREPEAVERLLPVIKKIVF